MPTYRRFMLAACVLVCFAMMGAGAALAQPRAVEMTGGDTLELAAASGSKSVISQDTRRLIVAAAVGWFSGAMIFRRIFRTPQSALVGIAVGTLFPVWLYFQLDD